MWQVIYVCKNEFQWHSIYYWYNWVFLSFYFHIDNVDFDWRFILKIFQNLELLTFVRIEFSWSQFKWVIGHSLLLINEILFLFVMFLYHAPKTRICNREKFLWRTCYKPSVYWYLYTLWTRLWWRWTRLWIHYYHTIKNDSPIRCLYQSLKSHLCLRSPDF